MRTLVVSLAVIGVAVAFSFNYRSFAPEPPAAAEDFGEGGIPDDDPGTATADPLADLVMSRSAAKDVIARDVLAGRTGLAAAAALFAKLNALPPAVPPVHQGIRVAAEGAGWLGPGEDCSAGDLIAAQVGLWVEAVALREDPSGWRAAAAVRAAFDEGRAAGRFDPLPAADEDGLWRILAQADEEAGRYRRHRLTPSLPAPAP